MRPAEVARRLTARDLTEFQALFEIEPWGSTADDIRHALLCATIKNFAWGSPGDYRPTDCLPPWARPPAPPPSAAIHKARWLVWAASTRAKSAAATANKPAAPAAPPKPPPVRPA